MAPTHTPIKPFVGRLLGAALVLLPTAAIAENNLPLYPQWDWVSKQHLDDPSRCNTACDGAYVAPEPDWPDADQDPDGSPLRASAANSSHEGNSVSLSGDVVLSQGNRQLRADNASLDRRSHELLVDGNIVVREPDLLVRANKAQLNTESNLGRFEASSFLHHESGSRGEANLIQRSSVNTLDLQQGYVTQCTPDDEVWSIHANNIHLNTWEGWGSAKHARLNILDVPVFYVPYMTFPIDKRRKSGFLWPTLGSSKSNGFEISAPYYLNLAPNYDATIAPRYIEKRGTMTELELRHLSRYGQWTLAGAHLLDDQYTDQPPKNPSDPLEDQGPPQEKRWIGSATQAGTAFGLSTRVDYNKVSDSDYFKDLSLDNLDVKRTTHLNQEVAFGYRNANWQAELKAQQYQTVDELLTKQYQLMPQLSVERNTLGANFSTEWLFDAEFTDFQHDQSIDDGGRFVTGQRAFAEAGVSYPMRWAAGFIIPTTKLRSVSYDLEAFQPGDDDSPSATTPLATLDMGLVFERASHFSGSQYTQTLEPRLYYFYSDFVEQAGSPNFDTKELDFGYSQLFRDTRFSGNDRLDDANQSSVGITSRFLDNNDGREVLSLSLGQIFYFEDRRVQLGGSLPPALSPENTHSNSQIASEIFFQPSEKVWLTNTLLWDSRKDILDEGGIAFHYQSDSNSLYNLGYRFRRDGASNLGSGQRDLSQADASIALPITERWSLFSRYRYDIEEHRSLDEMAGIQYEDCCWMVRMVYQQGIEDEFIDPISGTIVVEQDYAFIFEFQLKGLGSLGGKARALLENNILGYEDLD